MEASRARSADEELEAERWMYASILGCMSVSCTSKSTEGPQLEALTHETMS